MTRYIKSIRYIQRYAGILAYMGFAIVAAFSYEVLQKSIPDEIYIAQNEETIDLQVPAIETQLVAANVEKVSTNLAGMVQKNAYKGADITPGTITYSCNLFGVLPIKQIQAHITGGQQLYACGVPVGIYTKTQGVLVIGMGKITDQNGSVRSPSENIIRSGDYITKVNQVEIEDKEDLMEMVEQSQGNELVLTVNREGNTLDTRLTPAMTDQGPKLGLWVRDDLAGIGTMTYITEDMRYGALGHSINDADTGSSLKLGEGLLYESEIAGIVKGTTGTPGELTGVIRYSKGNRLGTITKNTTQGIFGALECYPRQYSNQQKYTVGHKQEIERAPATILCALEEEVCEYSIQITDINYQKDDENKEIMFEVTDQTLLAKTGGIVQGMSGSPIIQNGKLIGAVTHVFVQDAKRGYGIFIEDMLAE